MAKGKFKSERQRRWMWSNVPTAARKWAHSVKTAKGDWTGSGKGGKRRGGKRRRGR